MEKECNEYKEIVVVKNVKVKLPKRGSPHLRQMAQHSFVLCGGSTIEVPKHWADGIPIEDVILNRHFYGFSTYDFGNNFATVTVKVIEKTTRDGRIFTMLDFQKEKNTNPVYELKFSKEGSKEGGDVLVAGTSTFIKFSPL